MALQVQFDLFKTKEECEIETLKEIVNTIKTSSDKVRRGTYASISELKKENMDLKSRLEIIERNICRGV